MSLRKSCSASVVISAAGSASGSALVGLVRVNDGDLRLLERRVEVVELRRLELELVECQRELVRVELARAVPGLEQPLPLVADEDVLDRRSSGSALRFFCGQTAPLPRRPSHGSYRYGGRQRTGTRESCRTVANSCIVIAATTSERARANRFAGLQSPGLRIFLGSGLVLFLELVLIRELGAKVVHLSYFTNFVLLGSFLGVGLGFLASRTAQSRVAFPADPRRASGVRHARAGGDRPRSDQIIYFTGRTLGPADLGDPARSSSPPSRLRVRARRSSSVGASAQLPALDAYRLDLLGSLAGIVVFTGLVVPAAHRRSSGASCSSPCSSACSVRQRAVTFSCALLIALVRRRPLRATGSPGRRTTGSSTRRLDLGDGETAMTRQCQRRAAPGRAERGRAAARGTAVRPPVRAARPETARQCPRSSARERATTSRSRSTKGAEARRRRRDRPARSSTSGRRSTRTGPYDDPRVTTHIDDGRAFLERHGRRTTT